RRHRARAPDRESAQVLAAALPSRGQALRHGRGRLHRRAASLGRGGRGAAAATRRRLRHPRASPRRGSGRGVEGGQPTLMIQNELGLHARAATKLVQLASKYPCEITVTKDGHEVNGKSIMGVLMLVASKGTSVTLRAKGERAGEAVAAIAALIDDKFGE